MTNGKMIYIYTDSRQAVATFLRPQVVSELIIEPILANISLYQGNS